MSATKRYLEDHNYFYFESDPDDSDYELYLRRLAQDIAAESDCFQHHTGNPETELFGSVRTERIRQIMEWLKSGKA